ncbi:methyl-accepting chemotaxis protein [Paenibacillus puldeungensis]|uniref:Methyl-accepting chemotaxis protein n=1 Tax=Paenibacillus puldeungensis TaxID=696536 RepID=A0ABW3RZ63_9BACL
MNFRSIGTKISLIVIGILLAFSAAISYVAVGQMEKGIKTFATAKAKSDLELAMRYVDSRYPGDWQIHDDALYKGEVKINENYEMVDEIGKLTGDTVTIFQGDTRASTNVLQDGKRSVGTKVSDKVAEKVLTGGQSYFGEAVVVGKTYQAAYQPVKGKDGSVIGIFYVGAPQHLIDVIQKSFIQRFVIVFAVAIVISIVVVVLYIGRINKRLGAVAKAMEDAGEGDFTSVVTDASRDEIGKLGHSFNQMGSNLRELVQSGLLASEKVAQSAKELHAASDKTTEESTVIAAAIDQVAQGAENQTQSTMENARAFEEIAIGVQNIAEHAAEAAEAAGQSRRQAEVGGEQVRQVVEQMGSIDRSVQSSSSSIRLLNEKSQKIAEMIEAIQGVSKQTNLLALNASIEAARAGQEGRGFAVVATEIRKLAEQSGASSDHIAEVMGEIEENIRESLQAMGGVIREVKSGIEITEETDRSFAEILKSSGHIADLIEQLAAAAEQISAGVEEVTASVNVIADIARDTGASAEEVAASAANQLTAVAEVNRSCSVLSQISHELHQVLSKFKVS